MTRVKSVRLRAPAKINLGLRVLAKRTDGSHDIQTAFLALDWYDQLSISSSSVISMTCTNPSLPTDEGNLVIRAARLLADRFSVSSGAAIHLEKNLPYGAGLGSGSSDAAATLTGLAKFWNCDVGPKDLHVLATELGSDVPFFLDPRPAVGEGRGERLTYLDKLFMSSDSKPTFMVAVVTPPIVISTKEAFSLVYPRSGTDRDSLITILKGSVDGWQYELTNDFEEPIFNRYSELRDIKRHLLGSGAMYASLSGSGSAVFGLFESVEKARNALATSGNDGWVGRPINT